MPGAEVDFPSLQFWAYIGAGLSMLVICSGTAAINVALLELDATHLAVLKRSTASPAVQRQVAIAEPLLRRHHLVVLSLVLLHAMCDEALPIILEAISPNEYYALAAAVPLVLLFGELVPSVLVTGRPLAVLSTLAPLAWIIVALTAVISAPLAWLAHKLGGHDDKLNPRSYRRHELTAFLRLHLRGTQGNSGEGNRFSAPDGDAQPGGKSVDGFAGHTGRGSMEGISLGPVSCHSDEDTMRAPLLSDPTLKEDHLLTSQEVRVLEGALSLASRHVCDRMVPIDVVFSLSSDAILSPALVQQIAGTAHSRIPVHEGTDKSRIIGLLLVKLLLRLDSHGYGIRIGSLPLIQPIVLDPHTTMLAALRAFEDNKAHMALVSSQPSAVHAIMASFEASEARRASLEDAGLGSSSEDEEGKGETHAKLMQHGAPAAHPRHAWLHPELLSTSSPSKHGPILGITTLEDCLLEVLKGQSWGSASSSSGTSATATGSHSHQHHHAHPQHAHNHRHKHQHAAHRSDGHVGHPHEGRKDRRSSRGSGGSSIDASVASLASSVTDKPSVSLFQGLSMRGASILHAASPFKSSTPRHDGEGGGTGHVHASGSGSSKHAMPLMPLVRHNGHVPVVVHDHEDETQHGPGRGRRERRKGSVHLISDAHELQSLMAHWEGKKGTWARVEAQQSARGSSGSRTPRNAPTQAAILGACESAVPPSSVTPPS